jgi:hypothetical protein
MTTTADIFLKAYADGKRDFGGANLSGADLSGAYLGGQWIISGPTRSDGYVFFLMRITQYPEPHVIAGCRDFSMPEARKHWQDTRAGTALGDETFAILDCLEAMQKARGLT